MQEFLNWIWIGLWISKKFKNANGIFTQAIFRGSVNQVKFRYFALPFIDLHGDDVIESDAEDDPGPHVGIVSVWNNRYCWISEAVIIWGANHRVVRTRESSR